MSYSVAIIGAGWYGCHIGVSLAALGFEVAVYEKHKRPLHEASGNNQFRLHLGFHYPRHHGTRVQSRDGFLRFIERYPALSKEISENIYAVPKTDSLIDFQTYKLIMTSSGIPFVEGTSLDMPLQNIEGWFHTGERVLLLERARSLFVRQLGPLLHLDEEVRDLKEGEKAVTVNGRSFDFVVDATWGHFLRPPMQLYYEPTLLLYYELKDKAPFPAVTLVDGELCSIYPTEDPAIYTLSSVPHTPLGRADTASEARSVIDRLSASEVAGKRQSMEAQISNYVPTFVEHFRFLGPQRSIKTKPIAGSSDRSCYVFRRGRLFTVMSGKIDTIFYAVERILSSIELSYAEAADDLSSLLKDEIVQLQI